MSNRNILSRRELIQTLQKELGGMRRIGKAGSAPTMKRRGTRQTNYKTLKSFLNQLVQGHLQEFVDQEKTKIEKTDVKPNLRFD